MKRTNAIRRKLIQIAAFCFTNFHMGNFPSGTLYTGPWKKFCSPGLNCYSCPAASFACPVGALQAVAGSAGYDFSFYVTGFLLAVGVLLGRFVCGWLCPFGLIQELIYWIPLPKRRLPGIFRWVKYGVLVVFVLLLPVAAANYMGMGKPAFCQYICPSGTLLGGIPLLATHPELQKTIGGLFGLKLFILLAVAAGSAVVFRFFCKVLCPLGAIYGMTNKISFLKISVDQNRCVSCGKCRFACRMDVDPVKMPDSAECIRCGECVSACGVNAIRIGFFDGGGKRLDAAVRKENGCVKGNGKRRNEKESRNV